MKPSHFFIVAGAILIAVFVRTRNVTPANPRVRGDMTPTTTKEEKPGDKFEVSVTANGVTAVESGSGVEHRAKVNKAIQLQVRQQHAAADQILDEIIATFEKTMTNPAVRYVSLANRQEFAKYREEHPDRTVVWLDYAFGVALHQKTVLAVTRRDYHEALVLSKKELSYCPYSATAYIEQGAILNGTGFPEDGLSAYNKALQLAETFENSRNNKAAALRGIGFAKIDLHDYPGATNAFNQSLQIEPNNKIALGELEYIRGMEAKAK